MTITDEQVARALGFNHRGMGGSGASAVLQRPNAALFALDWMAENSKWRFYPGGKYWTRVSSPMRHAFEIIDETRSETTQEAIIAGVRARLEEMQNDDA